MLAYRYRWERIRYRSGTHLTAGMRGSAHVSCIMGGPGCHWGDTLWPRPNPLHHRRQRRHWSYRHWSYRHQEQHNDTFRCLFYGMSDYDLVWLNNSRCLVELLSSVAVGYSFSEFAELGLAREIVAWLRKELLLVDAKVISAKLSTSTLFLLHTSLHLSENSGN